MKNKWLLVISSILIVFSILIIGCKQKVEKRDVLLYATTESVTDMDPAEAYDFHTWEIFQNTFQGLLKYKPGTTTLVPGLAESYSVNEKGDVYTFKLRDGIKFSDGSDFSAEDVKWSIERVIALGGDPAWLVKDFVESVDVVDETTVRFNLKNPCGYFPKLVATCPYFPVNPDVYPKEKYIANPSELKGGKITGLGPYQIISFKRDEEIVLEVNPYYYEEQPKVKRIVIRYFADPTTMRLSLEKGDIDLAYKQLNPSDIADLQKNEALNMYKIPGPYIRYLCFETSESVLKNNKARQAVAATIDRNELAEKVFLGQVEPLYSMVPQGMIYHTDAFKDKLGDGNIGMATSLLSDLGYSEGNPLEFELWYTPSHYGDTEVNLAEVLRKQIEECPLLKVELKSAEWSTYTDNFQKKNMPAFLLGWYPDYIDPDNYTAAFAGTEGSIGMGIYFSDPEWDRLFEKEKTSTNPEVREDVFRKLQEMWTVEVPTAPMLQGNLFVFTQKNIKGVKIGPTLIFNYNELYFEE